MTVNAMGRRSVLFPRPICALLLLLSPFIEAAPSDLLQARAAAVKPIVGYTYQGCYNEPATVRALGSKTAQDGMTVELCASIAAGKTWFGLEYGRECWYGDTLASGTLPSAAESDCSKACSGDASELCGASKRLNLYRKGVATPVSGTSSSSTTSPTSAGESSTTGYTSMGCVQDNAATTGRTLPDKKYTSNAMTVELCASYAKTYKYKFFGLEYGNECWMANTVNPLAKLSLAGDNPTCTTACPGNPSQLCGGRARMNLYSFSSASAPGSTIGSTPGSATLTTSTITTTSPTSTAAVDLTRVTLSGNAQLTTDAQGKAVVNLAPNAPGQASVEVPSNVLPATVPGAEVAVRVSYQTTNNVAKRAEPTQCSLVILLGGVVIYNGVITTTDGNYTTVTVLTNYPSGPTTLIVTENCPGNSATGITIGGITVDPSPSASSSPVTTPSSQTSTQTSTGITVETTTTSTLLPSTASTQLPSSTTGLPPGSSSTVPLITTTATTALAVPTLSAAAYTASTCRYHIGAVAGGCILSGAPIATSGLLAVATGIPVPAGSSYDPELETCAGLCSGTDSCNSWALDRGISPTDGTLTCYLYSGGVREYAVSYDGAFRQIVWYSSGCYDCIVPDTESSTSGLGSSTAVTTTTEEAGTSSPPSTVSQTQMSTVTPPLTEAPVTTPAPTVPTRAAAAYTSGTCTDANLGYYVECDISAVNTPTATPGALLAVVTGVAPPPASARHNWEPEYETCAGECASMDGCQSYVVDTGLRPWISGDTVVHNWTCLLYDFSAVPYLLDSDNEAVFDRYIWFSNQCYNCNIELPVTTSSTADTSTSSSSTTSTASLTTTSTTLAPVVTTLAAPVLGQRSCHYPDGQWYTNPCTISGYPTPTTGLIAVATGVVPPSSGSYNFNPEYQACAAACSDLDQCTGWAMDRGQWPTDPSNWTCYLYSIDIGTWLSSSQSAQADRPIVWMDERCYICDPAQSSSTSSVPPSSTPIITAQPVPTIPAPPSNPTACGTVPLGPCSISGFPTATTGLVAVVTGVHVLPDTNYFQIKAEAVSCELACVDTDGCTSFALDRTDKADTVDWTCYLYGIDADSYLRSATQGGQYDPILWYDRGCFACTTASAVPSSTTTSSSTTAPSSTTSTTATPLPTASCTRATNPDPTLTCNVRGFGIPSGYSFALGTASQADCAAYCHYLVDDNPTNCVSYMWDPETYWCGAWGVDTWAAIGDGAPAGAGLQYRNNVIEDSACWDCTPGATWNPPPR